MSNLTSLYRDAIRRHAAEPMGYQRNIEATHRNEVYNPQCGDRIEILLLIADDEVVNNAFLGEACAICMASASLLCEATKGASVANLRELHDQLCAALAGHGNLQNAEVLQPLLGVRPYPSRIRCATLPWSAALGAL
jgi:nitrogen fixation NifU-like protein